MNRRRDALRRFSVLAAAAFALASAAGCAAAGAPASPTQKPVTLPTEAGIPSQDSGCVRSSSAAGSFGCRGDWVCPGIAARTLLCAPFDGGVACACIEGDASVAKSTDGGCATVSSVAAVAHNLCGWEVP